MEHLFRDCQMVQYILYCTVFMGQDGMQSNGKSMCKRTKVKTIINGIEKSSMLLIVNYE